MRRWAFASTSMLLLTGSSADATPAFISLGDLGATPFSSEATAVSADGSVVVGTSDGAFRWTESGGMVALGDLPGGAVSSEATGVSADGSVVVGRSSSANGPEAYRWTASAGMVGLGDLPAGVLFSSRANGVSADGSVVVGFGTSTSGTEAFRWNAGSGMVGLGDLAGGSFVSSAFGASADGSVVVGFGSSDSGEAFRWTAAGGMVGLGDLLGTHFASTAWAVSADASVVVGTAASSSQAFRWTESEGVVGLGSLPGPAGLESAALAVSADGSLIAGWGHVYDFDIDDVRQVAIIWDPVNGMRDLRELLVTEYGLDLTDWALNVATGVSADGRTLVGFGVNPNGDREAWIAFLPEPALGWLVGVGLGALVARHRHRA